MKKLISILLAVLGIVSMLSSTVYATCVHDFVPLSTTYAYTSVDDIYHDKTIYHNNLCRLCGFTTQDLYSSYLEPHNYILISSYVNDLGDYLLHTDRYSCTLCNHLKIETYTEIPGVGPVLPPNRRRVIK